MKILGIDPGTTRIGFGLVAEGTKLSALGYGIIEIREKNPHQKLLSLAREIRALLAKTSPGIVALEKLYFSTNQKTGIAVAESRGVIAMLVLEANLPLLEYGPREVKQAVTNDGVADKKAVAKMVKKILGLTTIEGPDDVSDALAIAVTGANRYKFDARGR